MQQPAVQQTADVLDPAEQYVKRRRTALWCTIALFFLSVVILVIGLVSATRTSNVAVAGYYSGIKLSFGAFLGIVGLHLFENRRPMLVAAIIFISLGVISCFFCAIVDGIIATEFIDSRPLMEGRCEFYTGSSGYAYDNYYTEVMCFSYNNKCKLKVKSNTCYCCDLHNCDSPDYHAQYFEFLGVQGCWDVVHLYRLLWSSVVLNVLGVFMGIITAAILGAYKDLTPSQSPAQSQMAPSPAPPPHILYNPAQHMLTYTGFCSNGQGLPAYPNYPLPMQHLSSYAAPTSAPPSSELGVAPPEEGQPSCQPQAPPQAPPGPAPQDPSAYMLTPNAPTLFPQSFGPFEKPPPYAC